MSATITSTSPAVNARLWPKVLARYREPSSRRSVGEIAITALPLIGLWVAMWASLSVGYWLCLLLAVPTALFLVRLFMIQHDCSHSAFFRRRAANDWVGRIIGVLTLTPHDLWQRTHAMHHAGSGNLAHRGIGDVATLTVAEYRALGWLGRLRYRVYRHPVVLFGLAPTYLFWIQHRLPVGMMDKGWRPWLSPMLTNLGIVVVVGGLIWLVGLGAFLRVHLPIMIISSSIGVWLFYVQHQFEHTAWEADADWSHPEAALHGSSHYDLPSVLRWFTANIGVHHVHHLSSRIPFYRLPEVLRDHPELADVGRIGLRDSLRCVPLVLWDEGQRRLVSFREMRRNASAGA
jgi:omega-6 fatty acid desaturase (delta-12 desaturase)